jgi:hypothetical protein
VFAHPLAQTPSWADVDSRNQPLRLRASSFYVDGEGVVCCPKRGLPIFDLLHDKTMTIGHGFDLVELNGEDLREQPLEARKGKITEVATRCRLVSNNRQALAHAARRVALWLNGQPRLILVRRDGIVHWSILLRISGRRLNGIGIRLGVSHRGLAWLHRLRIRRRDGFFRHAETRHQGPQGSDQVNSKKGANRKERHVSRYVIRLWRPLP